MFAARATASSFDENRDSQRVRLPGPTLAGWPGSAVSPLAPPKSKAAPYEGLAAYFRTDIFRYPQSRPKIAGYARRGRRLPVLKRVHGGGCRKGRWYQLRDRGYLCTRIGFRVGKDPGPLNLHHSLPKTARTLPYRYVKLKQQKGLRLYRLPTKEELDAIAKAGEEGALPEVVEKRMKGAYFLAMHKRHEHLGEGYVQTVYGRFVADKAVEDVRPTEMHGELLAGGHRLPLAFVFGKDRPLYRRDGDDVTRIGVAEKHARFSVVSVFKVGGKRYVADARGRAVARDAVRVAKRKPRPSAIPANQRWIDVSLAEQTLIAYAGSKPVFATVVSSGKAGFEPPGGVFRLGHKHVSATMNGPDPDVGWYEVEEVPWTMYYHNSYALHGAYWHDDFGTPRSHGCTNLAPADARWLFHWTTPAMPAGWHGVIEEGTWVRFTG